MSGCGRCGAERRRQTGLSLADPLLCRRFDADFERVGDARDRAWLPAWAVIDTPMLALPIGAAQAGRGDEPERALRLAIDLFALERQGRHRELMERRKRLRDLHAGLFASYVKTR
jgi:hypothetical protein